MNGKNDLYGCYNAKGSNATVTPFENKFGKKKLIIVDRLENVTTLKMADLKKIKLAVDGNVYDQKKRVKELVNSGKVMGKSETESLFGYLLLSKMQAGRSSQITVAEAIKQLLADVPGGYSFLMIHEKYLYAARDCYGIKPLCLGRFGDNFGTVTQSDDFTDHNESPTVIASSSALMEDVSAEFVREILPGEVISISNTGEFKSLGIVYRPKGDASTMCSLELIGLRSGTAFYHGRYVNTVLFQAGIKLGEITDTATTTTTDPELYMATILPDTPVSLLMGFANKTKMNLADIFYRSSGTKQLSMYEKDLNNKTVILLVESIYNKDIVAAVKMMKSRNVGWIQLKFVCPPIQMSCPFGITFTAASGGNIDVDQLDGVSSIQHLDLQTFTEIVSFGVDQKEVQNIGHCFHCTGRSHAVIVDTSNW